MEKLYSIKENIAEITLEKEIYPIVVIEKAISNFMENAYIKIKTENGKKVIVQLVLKIVNNKENLEKIIGDFYNELLREALRYEISKETKNLRELIVGRALYTTCIELDDDSSKQFEQEENKQEDNLEDYDLNDIAVNWFERKN